MGLCGTCFFQTIAHLRVGLSTNITISRLTHLFLCIALPLAITSCTALFFFPQKELVRTPAQFGLDYDDVFLTTHDGVRIHGWWIKPPTTPRGTVYFLHGNAENISTHIGSVLWLIKQGYQVLAIDYRGYGLSEGTPDVPEVFEDIRAGAEWLLSGDPVRPLIVFGQSLGASLVITAFQRYPDIANNIDGLISEAAFSDYGSIAREVAASSWITWLIQHPVKWLLPSSYDPSTAITELHLPILLIHSTDDEIIALHHAQHLFTAANEPKQLLQTTGSHIQAVANQPVRTEILAFIDKLR